MYLLHKFWARKPDNIVSQYNLYYSLEGDVVLDPFCGSALESDVPRNKLKVG